MAREAPATVRYDRDNRLLRLALLEAWDWCCYWAGLRHPLTYSDARIDHIIPQDVTAARLAELKHNLSLPADFDIHGPANLAPICHPCNTEKSNGDFLDVPLVVGKLRRAQRYEQKVIRRVRDQATAGEVATRLVNAATADLSGPQARREFLENAPAVVQTLALIDEDAVDFRVTREVALETALVRLTLDGRGRTVCSVIEDICGCTLAEALQDGVLSLLAQADAQAESSLERRRRETNDLGPIGTDVLVVTLTSAQLRRSGSRLTATFTGELYGSYSATLTGTNQLGDGLIDVPVTDSVELAVTIQASWDLTGGPGMPDQVQTEITADLHQDRIADEYDQHLADEYDRLQAQADEALRFWEAFGPPPGDADEGATGTT
ncbi:hypothetical protein EV385_6765 [Krasilnikovia cinnamomea]|uniref:Uncharacterized protein n=1 Tax=Krasilnikovia cinnamomea TaxID=349313 RepID=A0A4Q7Z8B0_9ACTN|nr:hypothetical protein [Krasilnikovia cinnamomea]RZU46688.1 hypothetical protein EV385_6765 [Krasilnikovia cinnamomea]